MGLKKFFNKAIRDEEYPGRVFVTTLIRRPVSMSGHKDFYCLAAVEQPNGRWDVHRRRYMTDNLGRLRSHGHTSVGRERFFRTLEEACANLEKFEKEHENDTGRTDKTPGDAAHVSEMTALVAQSRIVQARQAGALPKQVVMARKRAVKNMV